MQKVQQYWGAFVGWVTAHPLIAAFIILALAVATFWFMIT